jgi:hypothetical protein
MRVELPLYEGLFEDSFTESKLLKIFIFKLFPFFSVKLVYFDCLLVTLSPLDWHRCFICIAYPLYSLFELSIAIDSVAGLAGLTALHD